MSLEQVEISPDTFLTCMTHAFSTESEEVMGLLLGDVMYDNGLATAKIWGVMPQIRTDRRKDRVECSSEQVAACTAEAERVSAETGVRTRVVGWYHSHPHITVLPSHVDIRTQAMYQLLDQGFVGLIFSAFNHDAARGGSEVQVTAFQSARQDPRAVARQDSADLPGFDDATKEALRAAHAAELQQRGDSGWEHRGVALRVVDMPGAGGRVNPLQGYVSLQRTLLEEEGQAYRQALGSAQGVPGLLARVHHAGVYQQVGARLLARQCSAAVRTLRSRLQQSGLQRGALEAEVAALREAINAREHAAHSASLSIHAPAHNAPPPRISIPVSAPASPMPSPSTGAFASTTIPTTTPLAPIQSPPHHTTSPLHPSPHSHHTPTYQPPTYQPAPDPTTHSLPSPQPSPTAPTHAAPPAAQHHAFAPVATGGGPPPAARPLGYPSVKYQYHHIAPPPESLSAPPPALSLSSTHIHHTARYTPQLTEHNNPTTAPVPHAAPQHSASPQQSPQPSPRQPYNPPMTTAPYAHHPAHQAPSAPYLTAPSAPPLHAPPKPHQGPLAPRSQRRPPGFEDPSASYRPKPPDDPSLI